MPSPEKISGYQLAEHLLCEGGVEALIRYARKSETDWLELKAGMCLLPEHKKQGKTEKDLYWNIAKEVIALMNTSGGALVIGVKDETLNLVSLEDNDPRHIIAEKSIDCYIRDFVRANVWPSNLMWSDYGKPWELTDKQFPADLISYHHPSYTGPDGRSGEVVVLLIKPVEKIRLARKEQKYFALFKRTRGEVGEAQPIFDPDVIDEYKTSREIASAFYANIRDQFDEEKAATSESATLAAAIKEYYNGLVEKSRKMRAVFTSLDAEENVFSKDDVDQFYSPEAIETFDDEDRWLDDDDNEEEEREDNDEEEEDSDFDEDSDEGALDSEDDTEDEDGARSARNGDLLELLKSEQRVIVSGEPGGGKTTCLTYFTLKFAERGDDVPVLAVFIPMGQWRRGGSLSLMMERATGLDAGQLAHLMSENRLRLVIDAVNECPDDFRVAAIQNIGMFLAEHPTVPAVISTRHPKELSALHLPVFHVQPMDETHRLHYLERYLQDGEQAQKLLHQLGGMPGGETVAENPMLLRLIVEVYKESPEKRLPNGRASLYRRSLRAWYKRESDKAKKAGTKLQWDSRQTFELLAVLAFKSRQRGYRDVPLEEIPAIWGADATNRLEVLCQGPIIYCDDEFVRFRHETFQEYLCAEYLIAHQDELPSWTQDDYAQWGMPFAYAVELIELDKQQLPESFWLAAWNLNPWLGVALTDERKKQKVICANYKESCEVAGGALTKMSNAPPYLNFIRGYMNEKVLKYALFNKVYPWYIREDMALRYTVSVSPVCQSRWKNFETRQLSYLRGITRKEAIVLSKSWLTLNNPRDIFQYHAPEAWDRWIAEATPSKAITLVDAQIALPSDFSQLKQKWVEKMGFREALFLFEKHIFTIHDFRQRLPEWVNAATVHDILKMISMGLADVPQVIKKVHEWISSATPRTAYVLVMSGLAAKRDFQDKQKDWLREKSIFSAKWLIRLGMAEKKDFEDVAKKWIMLATPQMACNLISLDLATPSDFSSRLKGWLKHPQYSFVRNFICHCKDDLWKTSENIRSWIASASKVSASLLIEDGLASLDDFSHHIQNWIDLQSSRKWYQLVEKGFLSEDEYSKLNERYIAISMACCEVKKGLRSAKDFEDEIPRWIEAGSLTSLKEMIESGLITKEVVDYRIQKWIDSATPQAALALVKARFVDAKVFADRWKDWRTKLTPYEVTDLLKEGLLASSDLLEMRETWKNNVSQKTLYHLLKLKWVTIEEAFQYIASWGGAMPKLLVTIKVARAIESGQISIGRIMQGRVKNIVDYGAFISLAGDFDALLHITDMGWGHIKHPNELLEIGQELKVKIIAVDVDKARISVGLKQINPNPWDHIEERFPIGGIMRGKVVRLVNHGVFVEIAPDIVGFVHVSEFSWTKRITLASDVFNIGDRLSAKIVAIDVAKQKIALSLRQVQKNPWHNFADQHPVGSRVKGRVCNFTKYGAFIELVDGIDGMIHVADMSWTRKINQPSDCLNIGDEVEAIVLNVDPEKRQIGLGLKQAQQNPWPEIIRKYAIGMVVTGHVVRLASFGAFVELEPGVDGLIHVSEIREKPIEKAKDVLSIGEEVTARVIMVDHEAGRIALSIKALAMTEEEVKALGDNNGVVTQESKAGTSASGTLSQVSADSEADTSEGNSRL